MWSFLWSTDLKSRNVFGVRNKIALPRSGSDLDYEPSYLFPDTTSASSILPYQLFPQGFHLWSPPSGSSPQIFELALTLNLENLCKYYCNCHNNL